MIVIEMRINTGRMYRLRPVRRESATGVGASALRGREEHALQGLELLE
jgi:hypothetical protein